MSKIFDSGVKSQEWMSQWFKNAPSVRFDTRAAPLLYLCIAISVIVVFHNWWIYGRSFKLLRSLSDIAAVSIIFSSVNFLLCELLDPPLSISSVIANFINVAFLSSVTQICDNYLTFQRFGSLTLYSLDNLSPLLLKKV